MSCRKCGGGCGRTCDELCGAPGCFNPATCEECGSCAECCLCDLLTFEGRRQLLDGEEPYFWEVN